MKRNLIPPFIMLMAGLLSSLIMFFMKYDTKDMLIILLVVLLIFYTIGLLIKIMMDSFEKRNSQKHSEEGEVFEKELKEDEKTVED
ncbi:MAG: hypothetical protein PHT89_04775 [Lachnospiraceae bacterium]|nr:hypothetical protein [Lachnospiraceae bacterium]MDD3660019.1 hypothetical protein [Lachnospiraceae bacterium]